jgi:hypothetical protein
VTLIEPFVLGVGVGVAVGVGVGVGVLVGVGVGVGVAVAVGVGVGVSVDRGPPKGFDWFIALLEAVWVRLFIELKLLVTCWPALLAVPWVTRTVTITMRRTPPRRRMYSNEPWPRLDFFIGISPFPITI